VLHIKKMNVGQSLERMAFISKERANWIGSRFKRPYTTITNMGRSPKLSLTIDGDLYLNMFFFYTVCTEQQHSTKDCLQALGVLAGSYAHHQRVRHHLRGLHRLEGFQDKGGDETASFCGGTLGSGAKQNSPATDPPDPTPTGISATAGACIVVAVGGKF